MQKIGDRFLTKNQGLGQLDLPQLEIAGADFLCCNQGLTQLNLPQLKEAGENFLYENEGLTQLDLPQLKKVGDFFLANHPNGEQIIKKIKNGQTLNSQSIASLDKETELTSAEVDFAGRSLAQTLNQTEEFAKDKHNHDKC